MICCRPWTGDLQWQACSFLLGFFWLTSTLTASAGTYGLGSIRGNNLLLFLGMTISGGKKALHCLGVSDLCSATQLQQDFWVGLVSGPTAMICCRRWNGDQQMQTGSSPLSCFQISCIYTTLQGLWAGVCLLTHSNDLLQALGMGIEAANRIFPIMVFLAYFQLNNFGKCFWVGVSCCSLLELQ